MIQLTIEWHPWFSYEWWRDIGTGLMSVTTAVLVGGSTVFVAILSHRLARAAVRREEVRMEHDIRHRYNEQLTRAVDAALTAVVAYGNAVVQGGPGTNNEEAQLRAVAMARLTIVSAVSDPDDQPVATAIYETFHESSHAPRWEVRQQVAGLLAGALASTVARHVPVEDQLAAISRFIHDEEAAAAERPKRRLEGHRREKEARRRGNAQTNSV